MLISSTADKPVALYHLVTALLPKLAPGPALCFTSSVDSTHRLYILLAALGLGERVAEFSGSLTAAKRAELLSEFSRGNVQLLICSDVMTRGMDLPSVAAVINYDVPQHLKTYVEVFPLWQYSFY
jgi:ATP-dependent RNA helicase DDX51/DBP6